MLTLHTLLKLFYSLEVRDKEIKFNGTVSLEDEPEEEDTFNLGIEFALSQGLSVNNKTFDESCAEFVAKRHFMESKVFNGACVIGVFLPVIDFLVPVKISY